MVFFDDEDYMLEITQKDDTYTMYIEGGNLIYKLDVSHDDLIKDFAHKIDNFDPIFFRDYINPYFDIISRNDENVVVNIYVDEENRKKRVYKKYTLNITDSIEGTRLLQDRTLMADISALQAEIRAMQVVIKGLQSKSQNKA